MWKNFHMSPHILLKIQHWNELFRISSSDKPEVKWLWYKAAHKLYMIFLVHVSYCVARYRRWTPSFQKHGSSWCQISKKKRTMWRNHLQTKLSFPFREYTFNIVISFTVREVAAVARVSLLRRPNLFFLPSVTFAFQRRWRRRRTFISPIRSNVAPSPRHQTQEQIDCLPLGLMCLHCAAV